MQDTATNAERPPRLVLILGPTAVGKMTVGQELAKITGFKLLYNHMVVDLLTEFFPFGTPAFHRLARMFTEELLDAAAETGVDLILTHALVFGTPRTNENIDEFSAPFRKRGGQVSYVELAAPLGHRIDRNETENRRRNKKLDWAEVRIQNPEWIANNLPRAGVLILTPDS